MLRERVEHLALKHRGRPLRYLPQADRSIDVVVFDPPYIAEGGRETSTIPEFIDRYDLRDAPKFRWELEDLIAGGIREAARLRLVQVGMGRIADEREITEQAHDDADAVT